MRQPITKAGTMISGALLAFGASFTGSEKKVESRHVYTYIRRIDVCGSLLLFKFSCEMQRKLSE